VEFGDISIMFSPGYTQERVVEKPPPSERRTITLAVEILRPERDTGGEVNQPMNVSLTVHRVSEQVESSFRIVATNLSRKNVEFMRVRWWAIEGNF
jgi:hypothetical protein